MKGNHCKMRISGKGLDFSPALWYDKNNASKSRSVFSGRKDMTWRKNNLMIMKALPC